MSPEKQAAYAEAHKRGILPPEKAAAWEEMQRRGMVESQPNQSFLEKANPLATFTKNYIQDKGDTRKQAASRVSTIPLSFQHGMEVGMSDESAGMRAMRRDLPGGKVTEAVNQFNPFTRIPDGLSGLAFEAMGKTSGTYDLTAGQKNAKINEARAAHPVTSFGAEMAGGSALPGGAGKSTVQGAKGLAQAAYNASKVGAGYGAAYGYADAQENRVQGGAFGGLAGGVLGGLLGAGGKYVAELGNQPATGPKAQSIILEMTGEKGNGGRSKGAKALTALLNNSGFSSEDVRLGMINIRNRVQLASDSGERVPILATELQKEFKAAANNIREVFQQLATAPPTQGKSARTLIGALDDQFDSQNTHFDRIAQQRLGSSTVADEQAALAMERSRIGEVRDRVIKYTATDGRTAGARKRLTAWYDDFADDREVMGTMRAAARQMGYKGKTEVADAIADNPALLLQKFGEEAGAQIRSPRGASPVLQQARQESEFIFDEMSRYGRQADNMGFAPRDEGKVGPYKREQAKFRENYSQEDAIAEARGKFAQARDPVKADEFVGWYKGLPEGEQRLVQTVIRQDMEKMLRGGNIDDAGAYLTNLKKQGTVDALEQVLGEDGAAIGRAIQQLVDEQNALKNLDPRKGLQQRSVKGRAADNARNLYTTNPIARAGDKLPSLQTTVMMDVGQSLAGGAVGMPPIPYVTLAKLGSKAFRPRAGTREALADLLAMRTNGNALAPPPARPAPRPQAGGALAPIAQDRAPYPAALAPVMQRKQIAAQEARRRAVQAQQRIEVARAEARSQDEIQRVTVEAAELEAQAAQAEAQAQAAAKITPQVIKEISQKAKGRIKLARKTGEQQARESAESARQRVAALEDDKRRLADAEARAASAQEQQVIARERARIEQETLELERSARQIARQAQETADAPRLAAIERAEGMQAAGASLSDITEATGLHYARIGGKYIEVPPNTSAETVAQAQASINPAKWPKWLGDIYLAQNPGKTLADANKAYATKQKAKSMAAQAMEKAQKRKALKQNAQIGGGILGAAGAMGGVGYAYNEFTAMEAEKAEIERKRQERNAKSRATRARNKAQKQQRAARGIPDTPSPKPRR